MELLPTDLSLTFLETWKLGETRRCTYVEYTCYLLIHSKVLDPQNGPGNWSIPIMGMKRLKWLQVGTCEHVGTTSKQKPLSWDGMPSRFFSTDRPFVGAQDLWKLAVNLSWFLQRYLKIMTKIQGCSEPSKFYWQSLKKESLEPHILYMQSLGVKVTTKKPKTWMTKGWIGRMFSTIATFGVRVTLWSYWHVLT